MEPAPNKRDHVFLSGVTDNTVTILRLCRHRARSLMTAFGAFLLAGCGGVQLGSRPPSGQPAPAPARAPERSTAPAADPLDLFRSAGLIAHGAPMPFAGSVRFLASAGTDSVVALVSIGIATDALSFRREGDSNRADYAVSLVLRRAGGVLSTVNVTETVRVATLRETSRLDESVVFQQAIMLAPGDYSLGVTVRDESSGRAGTHDLPLRAPMFADGSVAAPVPIYGGVIRKSRDSTARLLANPRGAGVFTRDSTITLYLESYTAGSARPLEVTAFVDGVPVWVDTVALTSGDGVAAGVTQVPVRRLGPGAASVAVAPLGDSEAARTSLFVALADELPVSTHADFVAYLEYFAPQDRLDGLAKAPPASRESAWNAFLRDTDSIPSTSQNEALQTYLGRLRRANQDFREDRTPGWRTDRGMVYLLMGEPDVVIDPPMSDVRPRGRTLLWQYLGRNLVVEFISAAANQWRLTPASAAQVRAVSARRLPGSEGSPY